MALSLCEEKGNKMTLTSWKDIVKCVLPVVGHEDPPSRFATQIAIVTRLAEPPQPWHFHIPNDDNALFRAEGDVAGEVGETDDQKKTMTQSMTTTTTHLN